MTWTRLEYETSIKALLDATGSNRWGSTEMRDALTLAFRREWRGILKAYPTYRYGLRTATTDSSGRITVAALSSGSTDTAERFHQVVGQFLYVGTTRYTLETPQDLGGALANPTNWSGSKVWWRQGVSIQLLPVENGLSVTIPVNHFPTAFRSLSADGTSVEWIDDYEMLPVYMGAAILASKGDGEIDATSDFAKIASELRSDLFAEIAEISSAPKWVRASDSPDEWGG